LTGSKDDGPQAYCGPYVLAQVIPAISIDASTVAGFIGDGADMERLAFIMANAGFRQHYRKRY
jgi:hypothetical protein